MKKDDSKTIKLANMAAKEKIEKSRNEGIKKGPNSVTSINSDKAYYVEEKTKVIENVIIKV